jgi:hypothetical protein
MSKQFLYAQLNFRSKPQTDKVGTTDQCEVVVEIPKDLVHCQHSESPTGNEKEQVIALGIARITALATFAKVGERAAEMYDEGQPNWHQERPRVMNERPCDHEENGTRAWRIA